MTTYRKTADEICLLLTLRPGRTAAARDLSARIVWRVELARDIEALASDDISDALPLTCLEAAHV